jgi:Ca-activated chloride channel family protein
LIRLFIISIFLCASSAEAQYFFRGQTLDEKGKPLPYINIKVQSTGQTFKSDYDGSFGVPSKKISDSLIFSFDGYETITMAAQNKQSLKVTVKKIPVKKRDPKNELYSYIQNVHRDFKFWTYNNETYTSLVENPFVSTSSYPLSSFSVNTNRASYSNIRRFINDEEMVPPDAVRIEEMLNYFKLYYNNPDSGETFKATSVLTQCPWNDENKLLFMNLSAKTVDMEKVPPCNLVFLLDISGSMDVPRKLPLLKSGLKLLIKNLRPEDTVSLVTYGGRVKTELEGMSGNDKDKLIKAIDSLSPGGDTPGEAAIKTAYRIVRKRLNKSSNNRIILATDGDFNVGTTSEKDLANLIESQKNAGIYLTCIGVGMGNYKDSKLSVLAHTGNGNFAYIDNEVEAEKVFFTEFTQTMYAVADGAFITMEMNPSQVKEYRLIGYDNKRTNMKDTSNKIRGGEIGLQLFMN